MAQAAVCGARVVAVQGTYSDAWAMAAAVSALARLAERDHDLHVPLRRRGDAHRGLRDLASGSACRTGLPSRSAPGPSWSASRRGSTTSWRSAWSIARRACSRSSRPGARRSSGRSRRARRRGPGGGPRPWRAGSPIRSPGYPEEGDVTVRAITASGGAAVAVDDAATIAAISMLASREGLFQEPAGAIGVAGVAEARRRGLIAPRRNGRRVPDRHRAQGPVRRRRRRGSALPRRRLGRRARARAGRGVTLSAFGRACGSHRRPTTCGC